MHISLKQLYAESIVNLIAQILLHHGSLPVGEIGKELHAVVGIAGEDHIHTHTLSIVIS